MSDLIRRDDVDPRNLANPRKLNGVPYTDYERGYNDGIIDAYWVIQRAKAVEAEPVVHAHWVPAPDIGDCCYRCSNCGRIIDKYYEDDYDYCAKCGAHMDEEVV